MKSFASSSAIRTPAVRSYHDEPANPSRDSFTRAFEDSGKGWFWEVDEAGLITYLSPAIAAVMGFSGTGYHGHRLTDLTAACWDESGEGVGSQRTLGFYLSRNLPFTDLTVKSAHDEAILWSLTGRPVVDDFERVMGFRGIGADLSEKTKAEAELRRAARYDALTGLPNRATILRTLEEALTIPSSSACALVIVDLDRFKEVNDTHGHLVGDDLLRQAAERINQIMGRKGTVGRLGGDEFEVVIPRGACSKEEVQELCEACIRYVSIPYTIGERRLSIGASVGIAFAERDECDSEALFRKADLALYAAKEKRGTARAFEADMEITAANRQALEHDLRIALANGGLQVNFQPIVGGASEQLVGFEALVRWEHPEQGPIPPDIFVELAEESGLISMLGEWVLRAATREAAKWPGKLFVAVNVSPTQFADPDFTRIVLQSLADAQFPAARLELEVTEAVFLANNPRIDDTFAALKRIGCRLALDDFGTGYSSLAYLERAPFDKLKIDRQFVKGACLPGSKNLKILEAIVNLAHKLDLETTAEGAETHQELSLIRSLACSYVQGFIFGRPMKGDDALELASNSLPVGAEGFAVSRAPRHRLIRSASLHLNGQVLPVIVRNVSPGGALIDAGKALSEAALAKLELPGYSLIEVEIRWVQGKRAGIRFLGAFDIRNLLKAA